MKKLHEKKINRIHFSTLYNISVFHIHMYNNTATNYRILIRQPVRQQDMRVRQYDVRLYVLLVTDVMNKFLFLTLLIYISNAKQTTKHFYITQNSKFNFCSYMYKYMGDVLLRRRHRIIIVTIFLWGACVTCRRRESRLLCNVQRR